MVSGIGEAFSRVKIDALLKDVGWNLTDGRSVRLEYPLPDGTRADYVLADRNGRSLAVIEAKKASKNPVEAEGQALTYAKQLQVPFIFLCNGEEIWFWEHERQAHPHQVFTFFGQEDLERRIATYAVRMDPLSIPIDNRIVERRYQHDCVDTLCREMNLGRRKLLVEMATGTGKTRTAAALIKRLFGANQITRVLFLVDRITLAKQTEDAFTEHIRDIPSYVLRAGRRFDDAKRITITTLQSMVAIYREYSSGYFDLVITDECHRSIYGQWRKILEHFDAVTVGLTATPCVVPKEVLEKLADEEDRALVRDTLRFFEVDKPTFRYTLRDAIDEGYLVSYRIYKALTVKTAATGGFSVKRSELDWEAMNETSRNEFEEFFGDKDEITIDPAALERLFTIPQRNRAIVREFREVLEKGYAGPDGVRRFPSEGKTIVFAVTKKHAETLAQMLDQEFAHKKTKATDRYADFVVSDMGKDDTQNAAAKIKRFKKEELPQIVVSVNMLDTGFDCPEVVNLVMARFTKSSILYQQMRGRGTRKADHIKKTSFTIFDFVGNTDFHGDDERQPEGGLVIQPRPPEVPKVPRTLLVIDVHDHIDPASRGWVTLDDQGNEVRTEAGEARAEELAMRFEGWLLSKSDLNSDQERLLRMVGEQIKANAAQWESFELHHLVNPPFSFRGGLDWAVRVFGGEGELNRVLHDLNASVFTGTDRSSDAGQDDTSGTADFAQ